MADSIRKCLDEADTVSELKLLLSASKDKTFVVVEGDDDVRLFKSLLGCKVSLIQSYQSKLGVEKMIKIHFPKQKRVIGIRDKDYQKKPLCNRIFYCDYCCAEMMIIANDDCFERICNSFCNTSIEPKTLRSNCLKCLEYLSKLRYLNEKKKWKVVFDGIKPSVLYDVNQSIMDKNILEHLNKCNPTNQISTKRLLSVQTTFPGKCKEEDLLYITNGHDFINIFYCLGNMKEGIKFVGKALRSSFGKTEFQHTQLYNKLFDYQQKHALNIID